MNDIVETLKQCHRIVWDARAVLEPYWPTPTTEDALLFAFTELGEAIDAHLRTKGEYARNNAKDLSVLDELADCALMIFTAVGPNEQEFGEAVLKLDHDKWFGRHAWSIYASDMATLLYWGQHGDLIWEGNSVRILRRISTHPGMDLPTRLTARLDRIKAKRIVEAGARVGGMTL